MSVCVPWIAVSVDAPLWLTLVVASVALFLWLIHFEGRQQARLVAAIGPRTHDLVSTPSPFERRAAAVLHTLAFAAATIALAGPRHGRSASAEDAPRLDIAVCLDVSRSMRARDLEPDRLAFAHAVIRSLASRARGDRLALVAFAGEARLVVPLTEDTDSFAAIASRIDELSIEHGGTDLSSAISVALTALEEDRTRGGAIVLLTDGEDLAGSALPIAETCRSRGLPIFAIGLGSPLGSKIPVASATGERFVRDANGDDVVSALDTTSLSALCARSGGSFLAARDDPRTVANLYDDSLLAHARDGSHAIATSTLASRENPIDTPLLILALLATIVAQ
ncbi:MAG: VWA domain-containing protein [Planctomycetes bacterium]|nr:VWA domain-containing protein [Planctomycetota bacterium]